MNYLISGGGTGGHIFPAVSIANALKELDPEANILFVGALGRMEMERVPQAGYKIIGLPVQGFDRKRLWRNVRVMWNMMRSMRMVKQIIRDFRPDVGVGVGGYASGAAMKQAARMGVPILLQEQNGFAGVTNKLLKDDAKVICVAYEGMERFFPKEKIILTGNPVRQNLTGGTREEAFKYFNEEATLDPSKPTVLIIGGSLGARTINEAIRARTSPTPQLTWSSHAPELPVFPSFVCWASPLSSCLLLMSLKTTRPTMPWHLFAKMPPFWSRMLRRKNNSSQPCSRLSRTNNSASACTTTYSPSHKPIPHDASLKR